MKWWACIFLVLIALPMAFSLQGICYRGDLETGYCELEPCPDGSCVYETSTCTQDSWGCCTFDGQLKCAKEWSGGDTWSSRTGQDVDLSCPKTMCNTGDSCQNPGLIDSGTQTDVCNPTNVNCVDGCNFQELVQDPEGESSTTCSGGKECDFEVSCITASTPVGFAQ